MKRIRVDSLRGTADVRCTGGGVRQTGQTEVVWREKVEAGSRRSREEDSLCEGR